DAVVVLHAVRAEVDDDLVALLVDSVERDVSELEIRLFGAHAVVGVDPDIVAEEANVTVRFHLRGLIEPHRLERERARGADASWWFGSSDCGDLSSSHARGTEAHGHLLGVRKERHAAFVAEVLNEELELERLRASAVDVELALEGVC